MIRTGTPDRCRTGGDGVELRLFQDDAQAYAVEMVWRWPVGVGGVLAQGERRGPAPTVAGVLGMARTMRMGGCRRRSMAAMGTPPPR